MVETLYQLAVKSKNDSKAVVKILNAFKPKINKTLKQTRFQYRSDLDQELQLKLVTIIKKYDVEKLDGFWEFYDKQKNFYNKKD
ncbi:MULTISPECIES: helix-turn-helix domain-containing protein [unclassified Rummeliibacillus]|uniref:helix-turn-helix domain-containing protein n=1 Tax=unclassified Rummeliibacillus TaxID=2622809 RepID=UPI000E65EE8B|nr:MULTISPECIES: helix-turn-helix domain-containing protein [unclassified Rummeliibacillus]RIJ62961.1 hypothetical protein D1606_17460 [Rummeliibacillus sp. POC4]RPJ95602.1 hypothetical protein CW357_09670 [Rummeliibacillus sp. TYF005]